MIQFFYNTANHLVCFKYVLAMFLEFSNQRFDMFKNIENRQIKSKYA